ncbi:MAG TPA: M1 family aminopeptidase, partial [Longimicrobium sp.]
ERRYGRYRGVPQPSLTRVQLHAEIHPERRVAEIGGTYHLVNNGATPIGSIHLATAPDAGTREIAFDRAAAVVVADEDLGHRIYALRRPLQPGDSLRVTFKVHIRPRGFRNGGMDPSVVANGTFVTSERWLPGIGYQADRELDAATVRRAHGLAPRPRLRSLRQADAGRDPAGEAPFAFEAVVGTSAGQVAVAPGALRATWTKGGRRYFRYATDSPIRGGYALFSARYAVREGRWSPSASSGHSGKPAQGVEIRIYHHPGHTVNVDRMLRGVHASLDHYGREFGPYRHRHITFVEIPGTGGMHAYDGLITFQEAYSLFDVDGNPGSPDFPFSVVAHEVGHQWWGSHLTPARVEGNPLLSEGLAEYSAFQVLKRTHGQEHLRLYLEQLRIRYGARQSSAGVPLVRGSDEFHQYYRGPLAVYTMSEYIGQDRVSQALRRLLDRHEAGELLTALDLYRELQAVTPDSLRYLPHDLFEANTRWNLVMERATATPAAGGAWQVALAIRARKVVADEAGRETEVPMNDWVDVAVFAPGREGERSGEPLHVKKHRIRSGPQTITVTVPRRPARAAIDPYQLLIDLDTGDNAETVEVRGRTRTGRRHSVSRGTDAAVAS